MIDDVLTCLITWDLVSYMPWDMGKYHYLVYIPSILVSYYVNISYDL